MNDQLPQLVVGQDIDLVPGERINIVRNRINGDLYYTSDRYQQEIGGEKFVGIFRQPVNKQVKINWMRQDQLIKIGRGTSYK